MITFPNAKLNLGLKVLAKREDGYHEIETLFYPIPLRDILEAIPAPDGKYCFTSSGENIPGKPENNLCSRAFNLMYKESGIPAVHIHLHKLIPTGAGLGGGSSDAAHTLVLLNNMFKPGVNEATLEKYAAQLGSDCAFFVRNTPSIARGRGEILEDISLDLSGYYIVIVKPPFSIKTAMAYSLVHPANNQIIYKKIITNRPEKWKDNLINDFEPEIFRRHPSLKNIKDELYSLGAAYASMSGSGSAMYGIFSSCVPGIADHFSGCFIWQSLL